MRLGNCGHTAARSVIAGIHGFIDPDRGGVVICDVQGFMGAPDGLVLVHGLAGAHGFTAVDEEGVSRNREASCSDGSSRVITNSHGKRENTAPLNQFGPGSKK